LVQNNKLGAEELESKIEELRSTSSSVFRPWFKIKVRDALKPEYSAILTLFDINEDGFDSFKEGERLRILNLQSPVIQAGAKSMGFGAHNSSIQLNVTKSSKVLNMTQLYHKK